MYFFHFYFDQIKAPINLFQSLDKSTNKPVSITGGSTNGLKSVFDIKSLSHKVVSKTNIVSLSFHNLIK